MVTPHAREAAGVVITDDADKDKDKARAKDKVKVGARGQV